MPEPGISAGVLDSLYPLGEERREFLLHSRDWRATGPPHNAQACDPEITVVGLRIFSGIIPVAILLGSTLGRADPPTIPAISGTVVDALTGKPIAGVDVTLRATLLAGSFGDNGPEPLRRESRTTSASGEFYFPEQAEPKASGLLVSISEVSLSVNGGGGLSPFPGDKSRFVQLRVGAYFPMSVQFLRDCDYEWTATCMSVSPMARVRIALIPVLDDPVQCGKIHDPEIQESCRQLNSYRAAFLHLDTIAQLRAAKRLCESVDQGRLSQSCLDQLHTSARRTAAPQGTLTTPPEMDAPDKILIVTPVAGLIAGSPALVALDAFDETAAYQASYSSATDLGPGSDFRDCLCIEQRAGQERDRRLDGVQCRVSPRF